MRGRSRRRWTASLAIAGVLAGCAGTERLPECRGRLVPINASETPRERTAIPPARGLTRR